MDKVSKALTLFQKLEGEKATYLTLWQELGEFIYPSQQDFTRYLSSGSKRRRVIFDNTGEQSLDIFASSMIGLLANPATNWIGFRHNEPSINDLREVQLFMDEAQKKVMSVLNNPRSRFYDNLYFCIKNVGAFGLSPLFIDSDEENIVKFRTDSPKAYNFTEDFAGNVDQHFYEKEFTVANIEGKGWDLPSEYSYKDKEEKLNVLRHIYKNPDFNEEKAYAEGIPNRRFFKYKGAYYLKDAKKLLHEDYFETDPIAVGRWDKIAGEKWSDSPGRVALGDVKVVNAYERMNMVAMEKQISPPLIISSESKFGKLDTSAGSVNVVRGNAAGSYSLMETNGSLALPFQWSELKKQQIRSAFYVDVFQTAETPNMTATEAYIRQQEKLRGLGSKINRLQSDLIDPIVSRVLTILIARGELEVPSVLQDVGVNLDFVYLSPISQAQRQNEANSILQYIQDVANVAQISPEALDVIDVDATVKYMSEVRGVPEKVMRSDEDLEALRQARQQQFEQQQTLNNLQSGANIAKTNNEANKIEQETA